ncbi:LuxR C-terminal-related transcriptional regulator [Polaromonas sp. P1(28)-13]|nr:LuxR C-terminal-related transcriptional regulator [Polaromonas sp. P1(28)-13]
MHYDRDMPADFNTLLLRLYRLSQELPIQHFQDAALAQIKRVLPFDSSMWGTATTKPEGIDIHTVHLHEKSPEMLLAYEPVKHQDSAAATVFGKSHVTRTFHAESWFSDQKTRELRDFLRRFGHENIFIAADSNPRTNFVHWISLYRADKEAHCTEDERLLLGELAPHVMQALAMNRVMHLDYLEAADKALSPYGSAIADACGVLYHSDPQFKGLAQAEWNGWSGLILPADLMDALSSGHERFIGRTMVVRQYVEHGLLFLKARSRCLADLLTLREWTIARLIAKGESHKEIARALNRSPATVRNQIQVIYEKLQVGSIAMLIEALRRAE